MLPRFFKQGVLGEVQRAELTITLVNGELPPNNGGDEIELLDTVRNSVHVVSHSGGQAGAGQVILQILAQRTKVLVTL